MVLLEAKSLRKAVVPPTLIDNPSPGNLQSTRLALHVNKDGSPFLVYIASGSHVYKLQIGVEDSFVSEGKEGLLIPEYAQVWDSRLLHRCPHRSEIQSIALTGANSTGFLVLGSVDSYGHLIVSNLDTCGKAVANSFCKSIDVYYQDIHLRTLRTMKEKGGCLQRICGSVGDNLYAVCSSSTGNIEVGGMDRTVTIYDPRRWSALSRWVHRSKYEITGLAFHLLTLITSMFKGLIMRSFVESGEKVSRYLHLEGTEIGLCSKCSDRDVSGGWSESGSVFVADILAKESEITQ